MSCLDHEIADDSDMCSGIPPNPEGSFAKYTAPVVRFPDGSYVMESGDIAQKLDVTSPEPSLRLDDALQKQAQDVCNQLIFPMVAFIFSRVHSEIITDEEKAWFRNDRETRARAMLKRDSITLEEWDREAGGMSAIKGCEPGMEQMSKFLKEHKQDDGPFILGRKACYADLIIAGLVEAYRRIGSNEGAFEKLTKSITGLTEHYEACRPWLKRNNY